MITALIIDDEARSRKLLRDLLAIHCPEVEVLGEAADVAEGIQGIQLHAPQLVFLDVQMPDGTGFDLIRKLPAISFRVVFITAHEKYAIEAFRFSALDYILKPVSPPDVKRAVQKASETLVLSNLQLQIQTLMSNLNQSPEKIVLKTVDSIFVIRLEEIARLEADGNYTTFYLTDGRKQVVSRRMKSYEEMLPRKQFFRTHNSHLINLKCFREFNKREDLAILDDGSEVPVSTRRKQGLFDRLEAF